MAEVRRDMWGQEYRTSSADCAAALDAYYAATMAYGRGRGAAVLRAAFADPACVLAAALAAHFVAPRDPAAAAAYLAAAADNLVTKLPRRPADGAVRFRSRAVRSRLPACLNLWAVFVRVQDNATDYEKAVFRVHNAMVGEEKDDELAIERHFEVCVESIRASVSGTQLGAIG